METIKTDLCVIGAGAGGLSVAAGAVQMGARVVLIEAGAMGGDCLNHGCVPSKALLHAAAQGMGWAAAHDHIRRSIAAIAPHDSAERFEGLGVRVIRAKAAFRSPREVVAGDTVIRARRFVIATGSLPALPKIPGLESIPFLTNETLFGLSEQPGHLLILGGGPIGMEMAQAHRRLGCEVTVIEADRALGREDPEQAALVVENLRREGVRIEEGTSLTGLRGGPGVVEAETADGRSFRATHLLVATGRRANVARLALETAGIETTPTGIKVDVGLRTTNRRIYAIGDAAGGAQFTHLAGYHAGVVVRSALFALPARARAAHIPRVTYTEPELAQIGMTEAEARKAHGGKLEVLRLPFAANDRATITGRGEGVIKLMVRRGRPVGVSIAGPGAGELVNLWALVMANRLPLKSVAAMVSPYPTMGEINKRVAGAYFSPRLFDNQGVKRLVGLVQNLLP